VKSSSCDSSSREKKKKRRRRRGKVAVWTQALGFYREVRGGGEGRGKRESGQEDLFA
jgi:hypothetical protein